MTVELPKGAEGREIPLDTALPYGKVSGGECCMSDIKPYPWRYCPNCGAVIVVSGEN